MSLNQTKQITMRGRTPKYIFFTDWSYRDEEIQSPFEDDDYNDDTMMTKHKFKPREFIIYGYGKLQNGTTVTVVCKGFCPYFYIKVPDDWDNSKIHLLLEEIRNRIPGKPHIQSMKRVQAKPFTHFTGHETFQYVRLSFSSYGLFRRYKNFLIGRHPDEEERNPPVFQIHGQQWIAETYEANIPPLLRFFHRQNIMASGWSVLYHYRKRTNHEKVTYSTYEIECKWTHLFPLNEEQTKQMGQIFPPIKTVSFDIEASSSHGDFPVAKKDYHKLANDMIQNVSRLYTQKIFRQNMSRYLQTWLELAFTPFYNNNHISSLPCPETIKQTLWNTRYSQTHHLNILDPTTTTTNKNTTSSMSFFTLGKTIHSCIERMFHEIKEKNYGMILHSQVQEHPLYDEIYTHLYQWIDSHSLTSLLNEEAIQTWRKEIIYEVIDLYRNNNPEYLSSPISSLVFLLRLGFRPYYIYGNINRVFLKDISSLKWSTIYDLIPHVERICCQSYTAKKKDIYVTELNELFNHYLPEPQADQVIQIGSTFKYQTETDCYLKHIICLHSCAPISNNELIQDEHKNISFPKTELIHQLKQHDIQLSLEEIKNEEQYQVYNKKLNQLRYETQCNRDKARVIIESYATEQEVLLAWTRCIQKENPDIITGYNLNGFDFRFLYDRAVELGIETEFLQLGRRKEQVEQLLVKGRDPMNHDADAHITMEGRCLIDLFQLVKKQYNLDSYKLDNVCQQFLYMSKNDLPPRELFIKQRGTAEERREIARYCLIDCILCNRLLDRLQVFMANYGMSKVCHVPLSFLFTRGQGVKVQSLIGKVCFESGYLMLDRHDQISSTEKYEGAIVLDPTPGIYLSRRIQNEFSEPNEHVDEPVSVSDFNSLYPSSMISENLSHDSYVEPSSWYYNALEEKKIPDYDYVDVSYDLYTMKSLTGKKKDIQKYKVGTKVCRYAQPRDGSKAIVPRTLQQLLKARKETRITQKQFPKGSFEWSVYESLQLAYKITANSIYGQIGNKVGPIYKVEIASCTTAVGRNLITGSRDFVEHYYPGTKVVYGDSVSGNTPILLREHGSQWIYVIPIEKVPYMTESVSSSISNIQTDNTFKPWIPYHQTKECIPYHQRHWDVWTSYGWVPLRRWIRHTTNKSIYQVKTGRGIVQVTEDHSLFDISHQKIKPLQTKCHHTKLLHHPMPSFSHIDKKDTRTKKNKNHNDFILLGMLVSSASWKEKEQTWILPYRTPQQQTFAQYVYDIVSEQNDMPECARMDCEGMVQYNDPLFQVHSYFELEPWYFRYSSFIEIIPPWVLNTSFSNRQKFIQGILIGQGYTVDLSSIFLPSNIFTIQCSTLNQAQSIYLLYQSICRQTTNQRLFCELNQDGYPILYNSEYVNEDELSYIRSCQRYFPTCHEDETDGTSIVYDLETDNGEFSAGVGEIIVSNTDSIFIQFPSQTRRHENLTGLDAIYRSMELCVESSHARTKELKAPHNLEFEKTIWPFILFIKKRYCGNYYTEYGSPQFSFKSMGIELKRRDNAPILKHVYGGIIDKITLEHSLTNALDYFKKEALAIIQGSYPDRYFLESRSYSGQYKNPDQVAHAMLADRISKREVGNKIQAGDRIFYYHVVRPDFDGRRKLKTGEKIETPDYVRLHKLKIDYYRYLEKEIFPAVQRLFHLTSIDIERVFRLIEAKAKPFNPIKIKTRKGPSQTPIKTKNIFNLLKRRSK